VNEAAQYLARAWSTNTRVASIPEFCRPKDRAEGYRVAAELAARYPAPVAGWKIAATSEAGQRHINVSGPLVGRIFADRLLPPGGIVPFVNNSMKVAEGEFAFRLAKDLPPRAHEYSREEVVAATASMHLALEVPDSRYEDFTKVGAAQLIADTACACWLVLGPPVEAEWRGVSLADHRLSGWLNGKKVNEGSGRAALGDPWIALTWAVNEASRYCGGMNAGDFVTIRHHRNLHRSLADRCRRRGADRLWHLRHPLGQNCRLDLWS
jgi:2-keto-4-pentenoate hydratase